MLAAASALPLASLAQMLQGCASMVRTQELSGLGAADAVRHIAQGDLSAERYAAQLLANHHRHKRLNAIAWINEARLLEAARALDLRRSGGERLGPLGGLPVLVKDNVDTVGFPTSAGTPGLKANLPKRNAPVVEALLRSGALLFGKANMHELAAGGTSNNAAFGAVRNPYDPARVPGGSSGGTAAALAARIVPAGIGTDTAGSVRIPAAFCGTVGFRPSLGAETKPYADAGVVPLSYDLDTVGPMARNVQDVALLDAAILGRPMPAPAPLRGARIGVPRQLWEPLDAEVARVCNAAIARLRDAGAVVVEIDLQGLIESSVQVFNSLVALGYVKHLGAFLVDHVPGVALEEVLARIASRDVKGFFQKMRSVQLPQPVADRLRNELRPGVVGRYEAVFQANQLAAIAFPTVPVPAPSIRPGGDAGGERIQLAGEQVSETFTVIRNTKLAPVWRAPGLSIPAGLTAQGLPVGLELDALSGRDAELLALGMAAEKTMGAVPVPLLAG